MGNRARHIVPTPRARGERRMERANNRLLFRLFTLFILVAVAFVGGFLLRSQTELIASWGIPVSEGEQQALDQAAVQNDYESITARVGDVERILNTYSLDEINLTDATYTMLDDLMKSTGDPYATYYNPDVYNSYIKESTDRSYAGIGAVFADYNGRAYVADVFEGSEAEAKGVQQGDYLDSIDGTDVATWSMTEVVNALAKDEGSEVTITWMRPTSLDAQTGETFTTSLVCKVYEEANLTTDLAKGKVGVIKLRQITQNSSELVKQAVEALTAEGATSFVLDLRDNPGGYLTQAVDIASLFIESGVIVEIQTVDGPASSKKASGATVTSAPLVVLVNKYTAAAAEVLASALQDNQRAQIVGETTLGKGSVQVVRELDFGGAVRYTAALYMTPLGYQIDGVGIVPQVAVADDGGKGKNDDQLNLALDTARALAKE